jgi:dTDP-glucose 4,6-dehydratase
MVKRVFLTGAGGFVGSHVLRHLLVNTDYEIICPVTFTHRGKSDRIASALESNEAWQRRVMVVMCDLTAPIDEPTISRIGHIDEIWNVASDSHVDRSIEEPGPFIQNNVALMVNVLDYARKVQPKLILQMSTDEVYGPAPQDYRHKEWDAIKPSNPYSGSKAAQEAICYSYWRTYNLPIVITNTMNIIGEMQDPEKFVPMTIKKLLAGEPMTVHVSPEGISGSRFYLHARNLADAWLAISRDAMLIGEVAQYPEYDDPDRYHIVGEREVSNVEMVELIADILGVEPRMDKVNFHESRPGHDLRYALDGRKIRREIAWTAPISFEESLRRTVEWTIKHPEWLL